MSVGVGVRSTAGKSLPGARNAPFVFKVEEIFDEGMGISMAGRLDLGAAIVGVFSFEAVDLVPKHEQSASAADFFFVSDLTSIGCFSGDLTAGTIFEGALGTSSSKDGGAAFDCLGRVKTGSGEGS